MEPEPVTGLAVTIDYHDGGAIVSLGGELEYGTASALRTALLDLARDGATSVVVDLADLDFIDSSGISLLVQAKRRFDAQECPFVLRRPARRVVRVLEVAGLADLFTIEALPS